MRKKLLTKNQRKILIYVFITFSDAPCLLLEHSSLFRYIKLLQNFKCENKKLLIILSGHELTSSQPQCRYAHSVGGYVCHPHWPGVIMHAGGVEGWRRSRYEYRDQLEVS